MDAQHEVFARHDLVRLRRGRRDIERGAPPCGPEGSAAGRCPSYRPPAAGAVYILEATAGFVDMHGIDEGSRLVLISV